MGDPVCARESYRLVGETNINQILLPKQALLQTTVTAMKKNQHVARGTVRRPEGALCPHSASAGVSVGSYKPSIVLILPKTMTWTEKETGIAKIEALKLTMLIVMRCI